MHAPAAPMTASLSLTWLPLMKSIASWLIAPGPPQILAGRHAPEPGVKEYMPASKSGIPKIVVGGVEPVSTSERQTGLPLTGSLTTSMAAKKRSRMTMLLSVKRRVNSP